MQGWNEAEPRDLYFQAKPGNKSTRYQALPGNADPEALPRSFPSPKNEFSIISQSRFQHKLDRLIGEPQFEFRYARNNW